MTVIVAANSWGTIRHIFKSIESVEEFCGDAGNVDDYGLIPYFHEEDMEIRWVSEKGEVIRLWRLTEWEVE